MNSPTHIENSSNFQRYCASIRSHYNPQPRLLLIQTPQLLLESFNPATARQRGYYAYPPTGLQCLYESVRRLEAGIETRILDLNLEILRHACENPDFDHHQWLTILTTVMDDFRPSIVGISCMFDSAIKPMLAILGHLQSRNETIVVIGGVIATFESQRLLERKLCHFIVAGEGEDKIRSLVSHLLDLPSATDTIAGIRFHDQSTHQETQGGSDQTNFDYDLIASYDQVPVEVYSQYGSLNPFSRIARADGASYATIQFNRGCRAACTFCSVRDFMGKKVRARKVATVLAEMAFLIEQKGIRHFEWLDDDLLFYKPEFHTILEAIIQREWSITWSANNGLIASSLDEKTLSLMAKSGCIGFRVGFETGNPEMLRRIRKPGNIGLFHRISLLINQHPGMFVGANLIIGFPGEYFRQMMDTFHLFLKTRLDWAGFTICQAIRGASAFDDFGDLFERQMEGAQVKNFIPVRTDSSGQMDHQTLARTGYDIFKLDPESIPDESQVQEIWFSFNLVCNFILNKNLAPGGDVEKFIAWVEMARQAYPTNPYMCLFLALARQIKGDSEQAIALHAEARNYCQGGYWQQRFTEFGLNALLEQLPVDREACFAALAALGSDIDQHLAVLC